MIDNEQRIEDLVNKLMANDSLEKAPANFTDSVMSKIETVSEAKSIVYKPLIPKYIWWLLAGGFVSLVLYFVFKSTPSSSQGFAERYNLPEVSFNLLDNLSVDFSNILMYATVLLAIMVSIQVPLLKQYFNNRLSY